MLIFAIVQGLTEFIPVSSSGHLVILHDILQISSVNDLTLDIALHVGSLAGVLTFFWRDFVHYAKALGKSFRLPRQQWSQDHILAWSIVIGTLPAAVAGFFLGTWIEASLRHPGIVATGLIAVGFLFLWVERLPTTRSLKGLQFRDALFIGFAQALALIPGTSRSGITIIAGMKRKLNRTDATRFSFLLSAPIIFGAALAQLSLVMQKGESWDVKILLLGIMASAVTSYLAVSFVLRYFQKHSLRVFAYYRFALGAAVIISVFLIK